MTIAGANKGSSPTVAVVGLGRMGSGIAQRVQAGGFPLVVYNRSAEKTTPFVAAGAWAAASPREAAAAADIVVTSLLDDRSVLDNVTQSDGVLAGLRPGGIHLGTTTVSPDAAVKLGELHRAHGSHYVGCNVLGRPDAAATGKLHAIVAGHPEAIERSRPIVQAFTATITSVGEDPAGAARTKLAINFFVGGLVELFGEVFVFAEKHRLDGNAIRSLLINQVLPNPAFREYTQRIKDRDFDNAGATLTTGLKDLQLILKEAHAVNVPLPFADIIRDHILSGLARGWGEQDWSILTLADRMAAGLE